MTTTRGSEALKVPTLTDETVRVLRERILAGEFAPGERLVEEQLAERFGVSRPPIREALRILSQNGLVVGVPRRGYTVVALSAQDIRQLYDMRFALERSAIELGLPVADPRRLEPLAAAVDRMRGRAARRDPDEMLRANSDFHTALVGLPGNRWLDDAYRMLSQQLELCMAMNLRLRQQLRNDPDDTVRRHASLIDRIELGDVDAVLAELADHGDRTFLDHLDELLEPPVTR